VKVCVLGSGGREHALVWRLLQDGHDVLAIPGSDAIPGSLGGALDSAPELTATLSAANVDLVVVGPEAPLSRGLSDALRAAGWPVVGPNMAAAQLETSKAFAKAFMVESGVATGGYLEAASAAEAKARLQDGAVVVKFDGLAAGKGVVVCDDRAQAEAAIQDLAATYGESARFVLEERLSGPEVSLIVLTDGKVVVAFPLAQDHKRLGNGDVGPNTGGMGVVAPVTTCSQEVQSRIEQEIVVPTLRGLAARGLEYRGFLYFGIMLTDAGPKLLEYNVRFGDPEAEALLPLVAGDFGAALLGCANGASVEDALVPTGRSAVCVVAASPGYPARHTKGLRITGLDEPLPEDVLVFHAGTSAGPEEQTGVRRRHGRDWFTDGGRVLNVVGIGDTLDAARDKAYDALAKIRFDGMQVRTDIGARPRDR